MPTTTTTSAHSTAQQSTTSISPDLGFVDCVDYSSSLAAKAETQAASNTSIINNSNKQGPTTATAKNVIDFRGTTTSSNLASTAATKRLPTAYISFPSSSPSTVAQSTSSLHHSSSLHTKTTAGAATADFGANIHQHKHSLPPTLLNNNFSSKRKQQKLAAAAAKLPPSAQLAVAAKKLPISTTITVKQQKTQQMPPQAARFNLPAASQPPPRLLPKDIVIPKHPLPLAAVAALCSSKVRHNFAAANAAAAVSQNSGNFAVANGNTTSSPTNSPYLSTKIFYNNKQQTNSCTTKVTNKAISVSKSVQNSCASDRSIIDSECVAVDEDSTDSFKHVKIHPEAETNSRIHSDQHSVTSRSSRLDIILITFLSH